MRAPRETGDGGRDRDPRRPELNPARAWTPTRHCGQDHVAGAIDHEDLLGYIAEGSWEGSWGQTGRALGVRLVFYSIQPQPIVV